MPIPTAHQDQHQPVARSEAHGGHGGAHDREAQQQEPARAEAVDQEAGRDLGGAGREVEHGDQQAERGIAHVELLAQQGEQRRQGEPVEVAHGVAGADQGQNLHVALHHSDAAFTPCELDRDHEPEPSRLRDNRRTLGIGGSPAKPTITGGRPCKRDRSAP